MKRHYEIMRVMRTKVLDLNVLMEGMTSMYYVRDAITYRVDDLASTSVLLSAPSRADLSNSCRQLLSTEARYGEAVPKLCLWNGDHIFRRLFELCSDVLAGSSSISTIQRVCGLRNTFRILIPQSHHTMMPTKTKRSIRKTF
jgi:hypothetical protein